MVSAPDALESATVSLQQYSPSMLDTLALFSKLLYKSIMYLGADIFRPWSRVLRLIRGLWGKPKRLRISRRSFAEVVPFLRTDEDSALESHFFCEVWSSREFPRPNERRFTMSLSSCFCVVPFLTTFDASVTLLPQGKEESAKLTINNLYKQVIVRCQICAVKYGMRTCEVVFWRWTKHDSSDQRIDISAWPVYFAEEWSCQSNRAVDRLARQMGLFRTNR